MKGQAWNFATIERYRHLLDNSICFCGSGMNDISFLCDSAHIRANQATDQDLDPDDLVIFIHQKPSKTTIIKETHGVSAGGHSDHPPIIPSLNPPNKKQVLRLKQHHEAIKPNSSDSVLSQLICLSRNEQDLYNKMTFELSRQVTINSIERGKLLSKLRDKFRDDLSRVTFFTKRFHDKLVAQRLVDGSARVKIGRLLVNNDNILLLLAASEQEGRALRSRLEGKVSDFKFVLSDSTHHSDLMTEAITINACFRKTLETESRNLAAQTELWDSVAWKILEQIIADGNHDNIREMTNLKTQWRDTAIAVETENLNSALEELTEVGKVETLLEESMNGLHDRLRDQRGQSVRIMRSIAQLKERLQLNDKSQDPDGLEELAEAADEMFSLYSGHYLITILEMIGAVKRLTEELANMCRELSFRLRKTEENRFSGLQLEIGEYMGQLEDTFAVNNEFSSFSSELIVQIEVYQNGGRDDRLRECLEATDRPLPSFDLTELMTLANKVKYLFASFRDDMTSPRLRDEILRCYEEMAEIGINLAIHVLPDRRDLSRKIMDRAKSLVPSLPEISESLWSVRSRLESTNERLVKYIGAVSPGSDSVLRQSSSAWLEAVSEELGRDRGREEKRVHDRAREMYFIGRGGYVRQVEVDQVRNAVEECAERETRKMEEMQELLLREEGLAGELEDEVCALEGEVMELKRLNMREGIESLK